MEIDKKLLEQLGYVEVWDGVFSAFVPESSIVEGVFSGETWEQDRESGRILDTEDAIQIVLKKWETPLLDLLIEPEEEGSECVER